MSNKSILHKVLVLSLLSLNIYANSILTDYRQYGVEGIEKK